MLSAITEVLQCQKKKNAMCKCNHRLYQGSREKGELNVFETLVSWSMIYTFLKNLSMCEGDKQSAFLAKWLWQAESLANTKT